MHHYRQSVEASSLPRIVEKEGEAIIFMAIGYGDVRKALLGYAEGLRR